MFAFRAEDSIASDGDRCSTSSDSFSMSTKRPLSVAGALSRDGSPSVVFIHHRPRGELLSAPSIIRSGDRMAADDLRRQIRFSDGALLTDGRSFRGGVDCIRSDGRNDVIRVVGSDGIREAEYDSNDDDDDDGDDANMTSQQQGGSRCGSPVASGMMMMPAGSSGASASCIGNQFHRRRRRTAFTSEQVCEPLTNIV